MSDEAAEAFAERERLRAELLADLPDDPNELSEDERPRYLAAHLLEYHRREAKPVWWAFFDRLGKSPAELVDDAEAIGELEPEGSEPEKRGALARARVHVPGAGAQARARRRRHRPRDREGRRRDPRARRATGRLTARARALAARRCRCRARSFPAGRTTPTASATRSSASLVGLDGTRRYPALEGILGRERPRAGREVAADRRPRGDEAARARPRRQPPRRPGAARLGQDVDGRAADRAPARARASASA